MQDDTTNNTAQKLTSNSKLAAEVLAQSSSEQRNNFLRCLAAVLRKNSEEILAANQQDLKNANQQKLSEALTERLTLNSARVEAMADGVLQVAALPDPIGEVVLGKNLRGGVEMLKKKVPLGTVLVIFESRPNVTIDIAALSIKSGNACILKGGKEALFSNKVLLKCVGEAASNNGLLSLPSECVQLVTGDQKAIVANLLTRKDEIDVVVPRGGKKLVTYVQNTSSIPVICHDAGICNLYIHKDANEEMANKIAINAKTQRPGVCNAIENILIHKDYPYKESLCKALQLKRVEVKLHNNLQSAAKAWEQPTFPVATDEDFFTEYLSLVVSVRAVNSLNEACGFINTHGSHHTDAIVCNSQKAAKTFENKVDSGCVAINASTRYHDGSVFGFGSEVGTSTQKLHVRGTMCAADLCTTKYVLRGDGQIRENF